MGKNFFRQVDEELRGARNRVQTSLIEDNVGFFYIRDISIAIGWEGDKIERFPLLYLITVD